MVEWGEEVTDIVREMGGGTKWASITVGGLLHTNPQDIARLRKRIGQGFW